MERISARDIFVAAERTCDLGSARVEAFSVQGSPVPEEADSRGSGVLDFGARRSRVTVRLLTERMRDSSRDRDSRVVRKLKSVFAQSGEAIFDGGRAYTAVGDGTWTAHGEVSDPRSQLDPMWVFDLLAGANDDATLVEAAEVRGVPTARYRLSVDLERASARSPLVLGGLDERRRWWSRRRPDAGGWQRNVPVEVWLDAQRFVRRVAGAPLKPGTSDPPLWAVTELWEFGLPVQVALPEVAEPARG